MVNSKSHYPVLNAESMVAMDQRARRNQAQAVRQVVWGFVSRLLARPQREAVQDIAPWEMTEDGRITVRYDAIESLLALNENDLEKLGLDRRSLELYRSGAIKHLTVVA